jgi:hypothetical protein
LLYAQALVIDVATHDLVRRCTSVNNLANLALDVGEVDRARDLHMQSLGIRHCVGTRMMLAESMVGMASVQVDVGSFERAFAAERHAGRSMSDAEAADYARTF